MQSSHWADLLRCRMLALMTFCKKFNILNCNGFTYLTAMMLIMVMGVMLGAIGQSWKSIMQREREEELIFRGTQYKDAITRWYKPRPGQHVATPLRDLKDLLQDPRSLTTVRYLRRLYPDPLTGKEWNLIADPSQGITGVVSSSGARPLKIDGFPDDLAELAGKNVYSDWQFAYKKPGKSGVLTVPAGTPGSTATPGSFGTPGASPTQGTPSGSTTSGGSFGKPR